MVLSCCLITAAAKQFVHNLQRLNISCQMDHEHGSPLYPYTELTSTQSQKQESPPMSLTAPATMPTPNPTVPQHLLLGPENTVAACPFCHATVKTAVKYTNNTGTHIAAALCCMICCCCCIPYCSDSAKNTDHYCPNCQKYLGTYRK